jgi:hypothetical protein
MKVDSSLILKPGAKLEVVKIDFNDPVIKKQIQQHHKACRELKKGHTRYPAHL